MEFFIEFIYLQIHLIFTVSLNQIILIFADCGILAESTLFQLKGSEGIIDYWLVSTTI